MGLWREVLLYPDFCCLWTQGGPAYFNAPRYLQSSTILVVLSNHRWIPCLVRYAWTTSLQCRYHLERSTLSTFIFFLSFSSALVPPHVYNSRVSQVRSEWIFRCLWYYEIGYLLAMEQPWHSRFRHTSPQIGMQRGVSGLWGLTRSLGR